MIQVLGAFEESRTMRFRADAGRALSSPDFEALCTEGEGCPSDIIDGVVEACGVRDMAVSRSFCFC